MSEFIDTKIYLQVYRFLDCHSASDLNPYHQVYEKFNLAKKISTYLYSKSEL